jgi:hypothetical protein
MNTYIILQFSLTILIRKQNVQSFLEVVRIRLQCTYSELTRESHGTQLTISSRWTKCDELLTLFTSSRSSGWGPVPAALGLRSGKAGLARVCPEAGGAPGGGAYDVCCCWGACCVGAGLASQEELSWIAQKHSRRLKVASESIIE